MIAQDFRHRITLQSPGEVRGPDGESESGWSDFAADVPASVVPLSGREFMSAGETQGETQARMAIRWMPGVLDTMRVLFDGKVYAINAVLPDPTARRHITLMTSGGVSNG
ncbi:MAG: phage head closure protein [Burkholderiaceae bacterium]